MGISDFGFIADACSACNKKAIRTEWLFETRKSKETPIYVRDNDDIEVFESLGPAAIGVVEKTRDNALFLSTCDQNNVKIAKEIAAWFNQFN
ncbi:MAG: hypothetical protein LH609_00420, partial [Rudanella sp.]|nr:hypothetical protein [Rudanella sp.]